MSSSVNLEGLEMKEATPSIAPSIYETQYNKKWRVLVAVGIGASIMAFSILIFYLSARSYRPSEELQAGLATIDGIKISDGKDLSLWRTLGDGVCVSSQQEKCPADYKTKPVILLALGGLSANQTNEIPALRKLIECGVKARSLVPSYPTYSYPNLYSIATGLYPESHGIVSNRIYDPVLNLNFSLDAPIASDPSWWKGEPIWKTLTKQGRKTAAYLWPGFDVNILDSKPTYTEKDRLLFQTRMHKILKWIQYPEETRPHLIMMYYDEPEATAQKLGPYPTSVKAVLNRINDGIDQLMSSLRNENLVNCVDVIVVSDHGMAPMNCITNSIDIDNIDEYRKEEYPIRMFSGSVSTMAFLKSADDKSRLNVIRSLQCQNSNLRVMEKSQVPIRYHYTNNRRIGHLILDSSVGYYISQDVDKDCHGFQGASGYNNLDEAMQGVFVAHGPSFKNNFEIESFRNIEVYNLICSMLNISPSSNNGTLGSLESILIDNEDKDIENAHNTIFLEEKIQSRYKRPKDGVLDPKSDSSKCHCDRSHWKTLDQSTTTATAITTTSTTTPISTTSIATTNSPTTTPATNTSETTATIIQVTTSPSSVKTSSSSAETNVPSRSTPKEDQNENLSQTASLSQHENVQGDERDLYSTAEIEDEPEIRKKRDAGELVADDEKTLAALRDRHCPMGCPKFSAPEVSSDIVKVLHQTHYIIGLPESLNMGIWVSFTLTKNYMQELSKLRPSLPKDVHIKPEDIKQETINGCWIADPRSSRSSSDQCGRSLQNDLYNSKNVTLMQLYPAELEEPDLLSSEGFFLSNMAPLLWGYVEGGRKVMLKAIDKLVSKYYVVNVQHGPIFDFNFDGKKDNITEIRNTRKPLIPSNYFFIVTFCNSTDATEKSESNLISQCPINDVIVLSFSFPNVNSRDMCRMTESNYLKYHMANIADIEEVSGNKFFQKLGKKQHAQLRSRQPVQIAPFISL